jgi:hypothetical protein
MVKESKILKTGITSTKSGGEILVRATPVYDEVGILDPKRDISIYIYIDDLPKLIEKLKEVVANEKTR